MTSNGMTSIENVIKVNKIDVKPTARLFFRFTFFY
jgi:hypothetical protein